MIAPLFRAGYASILFPRAPLTGDTGRLPSSGVHCDTPSEPCFQPSPKAGERLGHPAAESIFKETVRITASAHPRPSALEGLSPTFWISATIFSGLSKATAPAL